MRTPIPNQAGANQEIASPFPSRQSSNSRTESKRVTAGIQLSNILPPLVFACSIALWLLAINAPLWLDETISYWQISGGIGRIWARQGLTFPAYSYILWAITKLFGPAEFVLRAPSLVAMTAAAYVMYRIAREFFGRDVSLIVLTIFCSYPAIVFAAMDARPYAFAMLALNCAILSLLRWMRTQSVRYAVFAGVAAGLIFYFQYLFGLILVPFALYMVIMRRGDWGVPVRQLMKALGAFVVLMLPVIPRLLYLFRTNHEHVFAAAPDANKFVAAFAPGPILPLFALAVLIAAAARKFSIPDREPQAVAVGCLLLAFVPVLILFGISVWSSTHIFVDRYLLVAVPGIALCWGLVISRISARTIQALFCGAVFALIAFAQFRNPVHGYTWKDALQFVNSTTANDHAPVLICSDLPESDHVPMPTDVKNMTMGLFAPLSYYPVASPVVPLPRALNEVAKLQISDFLAKPLSQRRRFLVVAFSPSKPTIKWIQGITQNSYDSHVLAIENGITVAEFVAGQTQNAGGE